MNISMEVPLEYEKVRSEYYSLFGEYCPSPYVGLTRVCEAIRTNKPVPLSEYETRDSGEEEIPAHCGARTLEEEQAIIEYERLFGEGDPLLYVYADCERFKEAIRENKPIPESEYAHLDGLMLY
jgi:hypothetical protein